MLTIIGQMYPDKRTNTGVMYHKHSYMSEHLTQHTTDGSQ